jgi:hypothetical protein
MFNRQELQTLRALLSQAPLSQAEALWVDRLFARAQRELTREEQRLQTLTERRVDPAGEAAP